MLCVVSVAALLRKWSWECLVCILLEWDNDTRKTQEGFDEHQDPNFIDRFKMPQNNLDIKGIQLSSQLYIS